MIEDHYKPTEEEQKPIFAQSDNAEVKRMQNSALGSLEFAKYMDGSQDRLDAHALEEMI